MEQVDHKAEALRSLADADEERCSEECEDDRVDQLNFEAFVHSNLAIAEGQERVAEGLKGIRSELAELNAQVEGRS